MSDDFMTRMREDKEPEDIYFLMFKVLLLLLLLVVVIYFFYRPSKETDDAAAPTFTDFTVINIDNIKNTDFITVYDNITGVEYMITMTIEKDGSKTVSFICPLYCQDGSLKVY
jgi:flagellar basal body-associated protein FliL